MSQDTPRPLLTTGEAGLLLAVDPETIKRYVIKGQLEGFKLPGGSYRIYLDSVEDLMGGA